MASDCCDGCGVALPTLCCFEITTSPSGFGLGQDSQEFSTGLSFIISARALHCWGQSLVMTREGKPCLTSCSCCLEGRRWGWVRSCRELERELLVGRCGTVPALLYFLGEGAFSISFSWDQVLWLPSLPGNWWLLFSVYLMNVSTLYHIISYYCLIIGSWTPWEGTWNGKAAGPHFHLSTSQYPHREWARTDTGASARRVWNKSQPGMSGIGHLGPEDGFGRYWAGLSKIQLCDSCTSHTKEVVLCAATCLIDTQQN